MRANVALFVLSVGLLSACAGTEASFRPTTGGAVGPPLTRHAIRAYAGDMDAVHHAQGATVLGELTVDGGAVANWDDVREHAAVDAAQRGGTHFTLLSQWREGRSPRMNHAVYVVVRVPVESWASLPPHLRPSTSE